MKKYTYTACINQGNNNEKYLAVMLTVCLNFIIILTLARKLSRSALPLAIPIRERNKRKSVFMYILFFNNQSTSIVNVLHLALDLRRKSYPLLQKDLLPTGIAM